MDLPQSLEENRVHLAHTLNTSWHATFRCKMLQTFSLRTSHRDFKHGIMLFVTFLYDNKLKISRKLYIYTYRVIQLL